jgi:hypothetical protein
MLFYIKQMNADGLEQTYLVLNEIQEKFTADINLLSSVA